MPELGDGSDDEGLPTDADSDADDQPAEADVPSAGAEAPTTGVDTRGFGWEAFDGRGPTGSVCVREGSTRPPNVTSEVGNLSTAKQKREAIAEYKAGRALANVGPVAAASSGVPRLPRTGTQPNHNSTTTNTAGSGHRLTPRALREHSLEDRWSFARAREQLLTPHGKQFGVLSARTQSRA